MSIFKTTALAAATAALCAGPALAQTPPPTITITGSSAANSAGVAGFGDLPLSRAPFAATVISATQLQDAGIASLADITRLDAGITDAYNAPGYWGQMAVRGFTLDNRFNFRRDGLPVNAETVLPTANKSALELLKGISGIQAGTSSPGGLLNLVVKRPTARDLTAGSIEWVQPGTLDLAADVSRRDGNIAWRLNANATRLDPATRNSDGSRHLLALATEWTAAAGTRVEIELESSRQSQRSTPGFSLLSNTLPDAEAIDPRLNLNNQAWALPVVFEGQTGSVRVTQALGDAMELAGHLMQQRLRTDDRIAFPFGCDAEGNYDRYCSDGSFDFYDFRSEGERRSTTAGDLSLSGRHVLAGLRHHWSLGLLATQSEARFNRQAYNYVGVGRIDGTAVVPADPALTDENTNRTERSLEWRLQDRIEFGSDWQLWAGLRHSRLERAAVRTDGSRPTDYTQSVSTPWLALSWQATPTLMAYVSSGQGIETEVTPNRARYSNAGLALPALKSRQVEAGLKQRLDAVQWQLAIFDIRRPVWSDVTTATGLPTDSCSDALPCTRRADGAARHRGVELEAEWRTGPLSLRGSALWLDAQRDSSADATRNGLAPTNVPEQSLKLQSAWNVAAVPGLALLAFASHEGERQVLPDNRVATDGWTRVDLGLRYAFTRNGTRWVWRAGVDNVADTRAWKEAPFQFGHAYLYPLAPRTWRAALEVTL